MACALWLEVMSPDLATSGEFERLARNHDVSGAAITPASFCRVRQALDTMLEDAVQRVGTPNGRTTHDTKESVVTLIQRTAGLFQPAYARTSGTEGYVSWWTSPRLAFDTEGIIGEAHRLWSTVLRPNVLIEVPATPPGLEAVRPLVAAGVNISVAQIFSPIRYREAAEALLEGLEERMAKDLPLGGIQTAISCSLSPIDTLIDPLLEQIMQTDVSRADTAAALHGRVAIGSATCTYEAHRHLLGSARFRAVADRGALPLRLLWTDLVGEHTTYNTARYARALAFPETTFVLPSTALQYYMDVRSHPRSAAEADAARRMLENLFSLNLHPQKLLWQLEAEDLQHRMQAFARLEQELNNDRAN